MAPTALKWLRGVALTLLLLGCGERPSTDAAPRTWTATELWRADGSGDGAPFTDLRDFVVNTDGVVWALDFEEQRIRRFGPDGQTLPSVARKGAGPGELMGANGLLAVGDGTVWVHDRGNGRVSVFDASGTYLRQHLLAIGDFWMRWDAWRDRRTGEIVDPFAERATNGARSIRRWRRLALDGTVRDTLAIPSCQRGEEPPFAFYDGVSPDGSTSMWEYYPFTNGGGTAPDGQGGLWCAVNSSTAAVRVRIGTNDTIAQTFPPLAAVAVSTDERRRAIAVAESLLRPFPKNTFDAAKIPTTKPAIALLSVDDEGRLWVQHAAPFPDTSVTFDVHDSTGAPLGRLTIPHRVSATGLAVRARAMDLWIALRDEDDVVSIARYRLARNERAPRR